MQYRYISLLEIMQEFNHLTWNKTMVLATKRRETQTAVKSQHTAQLGGSRCEALRLFPTVLFTMELKICTQVYEVPRLALKPE